MPLATQLIVLALACFFVAACVWGATAVLRAGLVRFGVTDQPNHRSAHREPKPRGGGLALLAVVGFGWALAALVTDAPGGLWPVLGIGLALAAASFVDDVQGLPAWSRLAMQAVAVVLALAAFDGGPVFQGLLPLWLDRVLAALVWLWFINLFNFMDGIDGISGVETIAVGAGLALALTLAGAPAGAALPPLLLAAGAVGFLFWNWQPSKIFLGDSGSVGLGFLLGWLLLDAAADGHWAVALILPGYYLADATLTLLRRLLRGANVLEAHREHAYQKAVDAGWSHARTAVHVAAADLALVLAALLAAAGWPLPALALAVLVVAALLRGFAAAARA